MEVVPLFHVIYSTGSKSDIHQYKLQQRLLLADKYKMSKTCIITDTLEQGQIFWPLKKIQILISNLGNFIAKCMH